MSKIKVYPAEGFGAHIRSVEEITVALEALMSPASPSYVEYRLESPAVVVLPVTEEYIKVPGMIKGLSNNFSVTAGTLECETTGTYLVNGTSDLEISKADDMTYSIFVNDTLVPHESTTVSFTASGKKRNISITSIAAFSLGDTIEIHVKGGGVSGVTLTVNKLDVTLVQIPT